MTTTWTVPAIVLVALAGASTFSFILLILIRCIIQSRRRRQEPQFQKVPMSNPDDSNATLTLPIYRSQNDRNKLKKEHRRSSSSSAPFLPQHESSSTLAMPANIGPSSSNRSLNISQQSPPRSPPFLASSFTNNSSTFGQFPYSPADYDHFSSPAPSIKSSSRSSTWRKSTPDLPAIVEEAPQIPELPTHKTPTDERQPSLPTNRSQSTMASRITVASTAEETVSGRTSWEAADNDNDALYMRSDAASAPIKAPVTPPRHPLRRSNIVVGRHPSIHSPVSPLEERQPSPWDHAAELEGGMITPIAGP